MTRLARCCDIGRLGCPALGGFAGLLAGRPELTMMSPVAAKGFEI